jgi:cysteinyl-tRNA synthetase
MSKSAGNFFMVRDAAAEFGYDAVRYFILSSHYRSPINYRADILAQAVAGVERLQSCEENLEFRKQSAVAIPLNEAEKEALSYLDSKKKDFIAAMDEDFNTADALGCVFEMARKINSVLTATEVSAEFCEEAYKVYYEFLSLLGFEKKKNNDAGNDEEIEKLVAERTEAKKAKNFARADEIRDMLKDMGVVIEDTRQGVKWKRV